MAILFISSNIAYNDFEEGKHYLIKLYFKRLNDFNDERCGNMRNSSKADLSESNSQPFEVKFH